MDMMTQVQNPVARGIVQSVTRAVSELPGFQPNQETMEFAYDLVSRTLEALESPWNARAVTMFSEIIALGVCSRSFYAEPDMDIELARRFAQTFEDVVNCWLHD